MAVEAGVDTLLLNRTEGAFIHRVRTGLDGNRSRYRLSVGIGSKADAPAHLLGEGRGTVFRYALGQESENYFSERPDRQ